MCLLVQINNNQFILFLAFFFEYYFRLLVSWPHLIVFVAVTMRKY